MAEVQVLGNMDLRRYIFAYLRKRPALACNKCDCCLIWDQKKQKDFIRLYDDQIMCTECWTEVWMTYRSNPCQIS